MKQEQFKSLINECIREVLAEEKATKKKDALKKIQEIITENEIEETELNEFFGKSKPATDDELNKWLAGNKAVAAALQKMEPEKANKWKEFVKNKKADRVKKGEAILNVKWDADKNEWSETSGPSMGKSTGFSEAKK